MTPDPHPTPTGSLPAVAVPALLVAWLAPLRDSFTAAVWPRVLVLVAGAVLAPGQAPPLLPQAYAPGGVFAHLETWLAANAERFGFYRPYARDQGGVQPEPWHLSHAAVADAALAALTPAVLREALMASDIEDKPAVLARLPAIHERYVRNVAASPAAASRWA